MQCQLKSQMQNFQDWRGSFFPAQVEVSSGWVTIYNRASLIYNLQYHCQGDALCRASTKKGVNFCSQSAKKTKIVPSEQILALNLAAKKYNWLCWKWDPHWNSEILPAFYSWENVLYPLWMLGSLWKTENPLLWNLSGQIKVMKHLNLLASHNDFKAYSRPAGWELIFIQGASCSDMNFLWPHELQ